MLVHGLLLKLLIYQLI